MFPHLCVKSAHGKLSLRKNMHFLRSQYCGQDQTRLGEISNKPNLYMYDLPSLIDRTQKPNKLNPTPFDSCLMRSMAINLSRLV